MSWQVVHKDDCGVVVYERRVPRGSLVAAKDGEAKGWCFHPKGGTAGPMSPAPRLIDAIAAADAWAEAQGWPVQREQADQ